MRTSCPVAAGAQKQTFCAGPIAHLFLARGDHGCLVRVFLHTIQPAVGCDGQVGERAPRPAQWPWFGRLLAGYPDYMGDDEGLPGRPGAVWPRGGKSAGTAGGPGAVRRIQRDLIGLAASLAVFAGCAVVASDGRVGPAERAVFHAVNGLPGWLYRPMLAAQYLGVLAMPLVVAAFALVWRRWRLAAALVLVVPLKLVLDRVAK
jgi:hypothetical protein